MDKKIKIRNEAGDESEIMPESLPVWEEHGWTAVEDGSSGEGQAVAIPTVKVQPGQVPVEQKE